ncbi:C40 family peptidase [Tropheryma whipplei]|uniref:C40 family peptidase n=1 Tax=Tropheryma whipplei TaxID=2039 RepID=UPI0004B4212D|nr:C40 family peptidase [Tropheryma whipplei]
MTAVSIRSSFPSRDDRYSRYVPSVGARRRGLLRRSEGRSAPMASLAVVFISIAVSTVTMPVYAVDTYSVASNPYEVQAVQVGGAHTLPALNGDAYSVVRRGVSSYRPAVFGLSAALVPVPYTPSSVLDVASEYVGVPYRFGGADPSYGFDCSGLVKYVFARFGIALPHSVSGQAAAGRIVPSSQARPGDLVFMPGHNGFYVGPGLILHAPDYGRSVRVARIWTDNYYIVRVGG